MGNVRTVTFLPLSSAEDLPTPTNIISIRGKDIPAPDWRIDGHNVLTIWQDDPYSVGVSSKEMRRVVDWVDALEEGNIVVHCLYGQSRSAAVASWISSTGRFKMNLREAGCVGNLDSVARPVLQVLNDVAFRKKLEVQPVVK